MLLCGAAIANRCRGECCVSAAHEYVESVVAHCSVEVVIYTMIKAGKADSVIWTRSTAADWVFGVMTASSLSITVFLTAAFSLSRIVNVIGKVAKARRCIM